MPKRKHSCPSNLFCYICGLYTPTNQRTITSTVKERYEQYFFPVKLADQGKSFAPDKICANCFNTLSKWAQNDNSKKRYFQFDWPMSWREQTCHETDCYFCCTNTKGMSAKHRDKIIYPHVKSVTPVEGIGKRKPKCKLIDF